MQPLGNKVIVRPLEDEENQKTESGLYVPATATGSVKLGEVVAAGRGAATMTGELIPMEVGKGDKVLYPSEEGQAESGVEIRLQDETLLIFHETDLFCQLTEEEADNLF